MIADDDRIVRIEGAHNIRDLGFYPLAQGGRTRRRSVLRGESPAGLSRTARDGLVALGLSMVVDLRSPEELLVEPNPFAAHGEVEYLNVPLFGALTPIHALREQGAAFRMVARYRQAIDRCGARFAQAIEGIARAREGIALVHCTAGKDRTGLVAALLLSAAGVPPESVIEDYALTAEVAAPLLGRLRARAIAGGAYPLHVDATLASEPGTMAATLAYLDERYGGARRYLLGTGLGEDILEKAVARLVG